MRKTQGPGFNTKTWQKKSQLLLHTCCSIRSRRVFFWRKISLEEAFSYEERLSAPTKPRWHTSWTNGFPLGWRRCFCCQQMLEVVSILRRGKNTTNHEKLMMQNLRHFSRPWATSPGSDGWKNSEKLTGFSHFIILNQLSSVGWRKKVPSFFSSKALKFMVLPQAEDSLPAGL